MLVKLHFECILQKGTRRISIGHIVSMVTHAYRRRLKQLMFTQLFVNIRVFFQKYISDSNVSDLVLYRATRFVQKSILFFLNGGKSFLKKLLPK